MHKRSYAWNKPPNVLCSKQNLMFWKFCFKVETKYTVNKTKILANPSPLVSLFPGCSEHCSLMGDCLGFLIQFLYKFPSNLPPPAEKITKHKKITFWGLGVFVFVFVFDTLGLKFSSAHCSLHVWLLLIQSKMHFEMVGKKGSRMKQNPTFTRTELNRMLKVACSFTNNIIQYIKWIEWNEYTWVI